MFFLLFIGIRGGLTHAVKRYAEANNIMVPDYDASKPESWIVYLDATNLYLYCCKFLIE